MADGTSNGTRRLKVEAHDASRIEWSVYVPLPKGRGANEAEVDFWLEFPENVYAPHDGWDQLQILARLSSPDEDDVPADPRDFDGLRRATLAAARSLKLLRESLPASPPGHALHPMPVAPASARDLERILDQAQETLRNAQKNLCTARDGEPKELSRERALAGEFLSGQYLELLTQAGELCDRMNEASHGLASYGAIAERLQARVDAALARELDQRRARGELLAGADDPEALALFLDRAAQLKKHFQELLFLEPETRMVDDQIRNWVGIAGAATAFVIYFGLQTLQNSAAASAGLGIGTLITVGAIAYALKDRMKELTRQWLTGKLSHYYANRVMLLREPEKYERSRNVVLAARESLLQEKLSRPDALNPAAGAIHRVVALRYRLRLRVTRLKGPSAAAFERLKLVFRYDLQPILSRLDDSMKRVPVLAEGPRGVAFADAPRLYRIPLRLLFRTPAVEETRDLQVVLQRHGIARVVSAAEQGANLTTGFDVELPELEDDPALALLR